MWNMNGGGGNMGGGGRMRGFGMGQQQGGMNFGGNFGGGMQRQAPIQQAPTQWGQGDQQAGAGLQDGAGFGGGGQRDWGLAITPGQGAPAESGMSATNGNAAMDAQRHRQAQGLQDGAGFGGGQGQRPQFRMGGFGGGGGQQYGGGNGMRFGGQFGGPQQGGGGMQFSFDHRGMNGASPQQAPPQPQQMQDSPQAAAPAQDHEYYGRPEDRDMYFKNMGWA